METVFMVGSPEKQDASDVAVQETGTPVSGLATPGAVMAITIAEVASRPTLKAV